MASIYGALVVMSVLAGLFFLRYWRSTSDRFFIWFAGAFFTFSISWALLAYDRAASEHTSYIYAIRLLGFFQILIAIVLKNRRPRGA
ncbi:MAG TPA: DUF5985 family protein [Kofleriaceae bacterium]|nr:DUF5985 family protein [Kofleriaceae bacterium]